MNPINPWLDPAEVRRLAERLMRPTRDQSLYVSDAGFDESFVGFATSPSPTQAPRPMAQHPPALDERPLEKPSVASESLPATHRGPFLDRIQRFRDWMHQNFGASDLFLLDREGTVIFDEGSQERLHYMARSLTLASRRPAPASGNVHVKIGPGSTLEIIPVETAYGCLTLGAVVPEALSPVAIQAVMDALALVAKPPARG